MASARTYRCQLPREAAGAVEGASHLGKWTTISAKTSMSAGAQAPPSGCSHRTAHSAAAACPLERKRGEVRSASRTSASSRPATA